MEKIQEEEIMVWTFEAENLNQIYKDIFEVVQTQGTTVSPKGRVTKELNPTILKITNPRQRYCSSRDGFALPFSIAEVLWILEGRGDSEMICHYLKNFKQFLDEGYNEFNGAYGQRIRKYGYDTRDEYRTIVDNSGDICASECSCTDVYIDQLEEVYKKLKEDPDTRQAVMMLWNPFLDNDRKSLDHPCNNWSHLMIRDGKLNWTQVIRSNDLIWGVPQNIFQFTHLQEIVAGWLDVEVGHYVQFSDSLHIYQNDFYDLEQVKPNTYDIYEYNNTQDARMPKEEFDDMLHQLGKAEEEWRKENLNAYVDIENSYWRNFSQVIFAFNCWKHKDMKAMADAVNTIDNEYAPIMGKWMMKRLSK